MSMHVISYISSATASEDYVQKEVLDIVDVATSRNKANDVTGVLFYANSFFFQTIEGHERQLREIYSSIEKDPRHHTINKIIDEPIDSRAISDWSLDTFYIDNPSLINPQTIGLLQAIYVRNYGVDTSGLIEFVKKMIDEMDTFKILSEPYHK
jgi:hypothetical protein